MEEEGLVFSRWLCGALVSYRDEKTIRSIYYEGLDRAHEGLRQRWLDAVAADAASASSGLGPASWSVLVEAFSEAVLAGAPNVPFNIEDVERNLVVIVSAWAIL